MFELNVPVEVDEYMIPPSPLLETVETVAVLNMTFWDAPFRYKTPPFPLAIAFEIVDDYSIWTTL